MVESKCLFNSQITIHHILGGGFVADVLLWRRRNVTVNLLLLTVSSWVLFEILGHTLLTFSSSVLFLLSAILFLWAKSAAILNRPAPPLPNLYISEELANRVGNIVRLHVNNLLVISREMALGRHPKLFFRVAAFLLLSSVVGTWAGFWTVFYAGVVIVLTLPALCEKFEGRIRQRLTAPCMKLKGICGRRLPIYLKKHS